MANVAGSRPASSRNIRDPVEVKGCAYIGKGGVDEQATAALKFPGGIVANLNCGAQVAADLTVNPDYIVEDLAEAASVIQSILEREEKATPHGYVG